MRSAQQIPEMIHYKAGSNVILRCDMMLHEHLDLV